jgi:hypothetical protein
MLDRPGDAAEKAAFAICGIIRGSARWSIGSSFTDLITRPDQRPVVSPLYAADLLGGSLGSLAASLLLIPMLGLPASAALLALLLLLSAVLL